MTEPKVTQADIDRMLGLTAGLIESLPNLATFLGIEKLDGSYRFDIETFQNHRTLYLERTVNTGTAQVRRFRSRFHIGIADVSDLGEGKRAAYESLVTIRQTMLSIDAAIDFGASL